MSIWQNLPNIRDITQVKDDTAYVNTSLIRATNILLCISNGIDTNTEIAKYCGYSTSTVHRLLNVMRNLNWVVQDSINHRYYMGSVANQLTSNQTGTHRYLLINSLQEMGRLSNLSEETINLSILVQLRSVLLNAVPSKQDLIVTEMDSGYGALFAVGATARVLLSQLDDKEIMEIVHKVDISSLSGKIITDRKALLTQLSDIRRRGYGVSYGERIAGAMCISVAIKNYSQPVALSVLGPESRLRPRAPEITEELMVSARRISKSIISNL
jgi:DNA-binding IclR family transcriptional regulator